MKMKIEEYLSVHVHSLMLCGVVGEKKPVQLYRMLNPHTMSTGNDILPDMKKMSIKK